MTISSMTCGYNNCVGPSAGLESSLYYYERDQALYDGISAAGGCTAHTADASLRALLTRRLAPLRWA